jgi:fatty-acyl-CoA synthase
VSVGEVVARAPYLTQGYLNNPEASKALWRGGWMHTGDIGRIDKDGYLHLVDRQKDVIKSGGEWISSIELENLISQHQGVREVAVIGVTDAKWGERPLALVVPKAANGVGADELRAHLKTFAQAGTISPYAVPERWKFITELDKTSVGKIDKKRLRERYGDGSQQ